MLPYGNKVITYCNSIDYKHPRNHYKVKLSALIEVKAAQVG